MKTIILSLLFVLATSFAQASPVRLTVTEDYSTYVDPLKIQSYGPPVYSFTMKQVFTKKGKRLMGKDIKTTEVVNHHFQVRCNDGTVLKYSMDLYNAKGLLLNTIKFYPPDTLVEYIADSEMDLVYQWVCKTADYTGQTGKPYFTKRAITNVLDIGED